MTEARRRVRPKLTQEQICARIADITHGKWTPFRQDIYRIEQGTRLVTDLELLALAVAVECDPRWLLLGDKQLSEDAAEWVSELFRE